MLVVPLPRPQHLRREWFDDARDEGRRMEVSWHHDKGLIVISFWAGHICRATFRMPASNAPDLVHILVDAMVEGLPTVTPTEPGTKGREQGASRIIALAEHLTPPEAEPLWLA